ncbi:prepilin-type N-terminal cleavage/methylation domain-containing protein [bacterium]|nr:prepilin-type N-terminal cleavage/methylation domain-containing protein [bacterium]
MILITYKFNNMINKRGFTFVELIVVITILSIL